MAAVFLGVIELIVAAFSRLFASRIGMWAVQALLFFGIQWVSTKFVAGPIKAGLATAFGGLTADCIAWIGYLNIDRCLTLVISAYAAVSLTHMAFQKKGA